MISEYFDIFKGKYHKLRGIRFMSRARFKKALTHFERAILLHEDLDSMFYYSTCLISLNQHNKAISYLERVLEKSAENILVSTMLAECYLVDREWEKAEQFINTLQVNNEENQFVLKLQNIAQCPVLRENYATSKEYFFKSMDDLENTRYDSAFENIKKAIEFDDENSSHYFTAGLILFTAKKPKQEIENYLEKAISLSPQNENYKQQLHFIKTKYNY